MAKSIVVYYTLSANTQKAAETIAKKTGSDILSLEISEPYPADFNAVIAKAQEDRKLGKLPAVTNAPDIAPYDVVFVGSPNWFGTVAPPLEAFLKDQDFSSKTVVPFLTHGTGGVQNAEKDVQSFAKNAAFKPIIGIGGAGDEATEGKIDGWLKENGLI
jgi:flavodoxin